MEIFKLTWIFELISGKVNSSASITRMIRLFIILILSLLALLFAGCKNNPVKISGNLVNPGETDRKYVRTTEGDRPRAVIAVYNVCAWPNLTVLRDRTIVATIHNQPSHLKQPADVECWASEDGGQTWQKRGIPAPRGNPKFARGNVAAGLAVNGDLIVISSGWSDPAAKEGRGIILPPLVSRSIDGGRTWDIDANAFPDKWPEGTRGRSSPDGYLIPFGDILSGDDNMLRVALYGDNPGATFVYRSRDDGRTWGEPVQINKDSIIHEPALFHLGEGKWLVGARFNGLDLYVSDNDAQSWSLSTVLTGNGQHPGHFTRLKDGRLLLTYGNRLEPRGVDVRFSNDEGDAWSEPFRVVDLQGDIGYPSSMELPDGQVLTAYYASIVNGQNLYHMGVATWNPSKSINP